MEICILLSILIRENKNIYDMEKMWLSLKKSVISPKTVTLRGFVKSRKSKPKRPFARSSVQFALLLGKLYSPSFNTVGWYFIVFWGYITHFFFNDRSLGSSWRIRSTLICCSLEFSNLVFLFLMRPIFLPRSSLFLRADQMIFSPRRKCCMVSKGWTRMLPMTSLLSMGQSYSSFIITTGQCV